jgi:alkanesulfonate monooxygenase SsuD/methylene tetrahydromethanopterin reductase-like flavin-dependent oxidoreductase (luciferase family)
MSGGRFLFGVAPGWNKEEMENHGYDFRTRFSRLDEYLAAVKRIWANDVAGFEGRYVSFQKIQSWPKPVRSGGPPILIGGGGASALDRVLAWGDEWLAEPAHGLAERMEELASRAVGADRAVNVTIYGAEPGSAAVWRDLGAHRCVYWLTPDDATAQRREIDRLRAVILKD